MSGCRAYRVMAGAGRPPTTFRFACCKVVDGAPTGSSPVARFAHHDTGASVRCSCDSFISPQALGEACHRDHWLSLPGKSVVGALPPAVCVIAGEAHWPRIMCVTLALLYQRSIDRCVLNVERRTIKPTPHTLTSKIAQVAGSGTAFAVSDTG